MCEREPYGEFGYRKDMRQWKRQSQLLHVAVGVLVVGIAALFAWVVGL